MSIDPLDQVVSDASPVRDEEIARLDLRSAEADLLEEIVATRIDAPTTLHERSTKRRALRTKVIASVTGIAAISLIAAGLLTRTPVPAQREFDALAVKVANANQRLVIGTGGWRIVRADEWTVNQGEITFSDGTHNVDLHWLPKAFHRDAIDKFRAEGDDRGSAVVLGQDVKIWRYRGTTDYNAIFPPHGSSYMHLRGDLGSERAFRAMLDGLEHVSVDEWLRAMPANVVKPAVRAEVVDAMLADMPAPPGFDPSGLREGDALRDRYQLGAAVSGAVACGWLDEWTDARADGDRARIDAAVDAMATSHDWRVLDEMNAEGDYPEVVWEIADAMTGTTGVSSGKGKLPLGSREQYASALGCD